MNTEDEIFELTEGRSLIDVRGGPFDSMLLVGGKSIALNWSDCAGSIGQYMARAGVTDCEEKLRSLRYTLDGNLRQDLPISSQIYPFLELFVPGRYRLEYCVMTQLVDCYEFDEAFIKAKKHDFFYPYPEGFTLIATQASNTLDPQCVLRYLEILEQDHLPIALTATVNMGRCNFVLDGHHKLQAYRIAEIPPVFISVCRLEAPRLSADDFDRNIGPQHPLAWHYRKVKAKYDKGDSWGPRYAS